MNIDLQAPSRDLVCFCLRLAKIGAQETQQNQPVAGWFSDLGTRNASLQCLHYDHESAVGRPWSIRRWPRAVPTDLQSTKPGEDACLAKIYKLTVHQL